MFAAFFAAVSAILVACIISGQRKHMLVADEKKIKTTTSNTKAVTKSKEPTASTTVAEAPQKNGSVNAVLYIGCFLVIASMMGFCSYVDEMLVPPVVIGVTLLALFASIMLRLYVPFLKSSSIAFNISALIMFIFWFPSLTALGFDSDFMPFFVFCSAFLASIISALVFKLRGSWYVPFFLFLTVISSLAIALASTFNSDGNGTTIAAYCTVVPFLLAAIACRYLWRSHNPNLPVPIRSAVVSFSYIYSIIAIVISIFSFFGEECPFVGITCLALTSALFAVDYLLAKKGKIGLRFMALVFVPVLCIEIIKAGLEDIDSEITGTIILYSLIVTAFINGIISIVAMLKKPTENTHRTERIMLSLCIAILGISCILGMAMKQIPGYTSYSVRIPEWYSASSLVGEIGSIVCALVFCIVAIYIDRNSAMLIPAALTVGAALSDPSIDNSLFTGIMIGILSLMAAFCYFSLRRVDQKNAMTSSIIASVALSFLSFYYCLSEEKLFWLPILLASVIVLIFGYTNKKIKIIDFGYYILAAAFGLALVDLCMNFDIPSTSRNALFGIAWLAVPFSLLIRDLIHDIKAGKANTNAPEFYIGSIATWVLTGGLSLFYSFSAIYSDVDYIYAIVLFVARILVLLDCFRKKVVPMEVISLIMLVLTIISFVGINMWVMFLISGLALISIAVYAIYRSAKKPNTDTVNTDIQVEKTEDPDKKTLA